MEKPIPMDRLVCGDVGYGKTEIAIRAAFKAVQDGKQVADPGADDAARPAAPRHVHRAVRAVPGDGEGAVAGSRPTKEAKEVVAGLADGSVDVVIGTHRLITGEVRFKDLGLVVVDEEQRFGVEHKETLKQLRTNVDVLAMSATPIPRTLEMAVTGIREMSTLATPPEERHPVLTFVGAYDEKQITAAIRRELLREGQVFYVHNKVESIERTASRLHGARARGPDRRRAREDERAPARAGHRRLLGEEVRRPGLHDDRRDRPGHLQRQHAHPRARGRARASRSCTSCAGGSAAGASARTPTSCTRRSGRSPRPRTTGSRRWPRTPTSAPAWQIAMKDLEIRGAGNLLGGEQSGHIAGVGFDLYIRMVGEAVATFRGDAEAEAPEVTIELPVDAHIPHDYIAHERLRLEAYRKIAAARDAGGARRRSGPSSSTGTAPCPTVVENLFAVADFRNTVRAGRAVRRHGAGQVRPVRAGRPARVGPAAAQAALPGHRAQAGAADGPRAVPDDGADRRQARCTAREVLAWARQLIDAVVRGDVRARDGHRPGRRRARCPERSRAGSERVRRRCGGLAWPAVDERRPREVGGDGGVLEGASGGVRMLRRAGDRRPVWPAARRRPGAAAVVDGEAIPIVGRPRGRPSELDAVPAGRDDHRPCWPPGAGADGLRAGPRRTASGCPTRRPRRCSTRWSQQKVDERPSATFPGAVAARSPASRSLSRKLAGAPGRADASARRSTPGCAELDIEVNPRFGVAGGRRRRRPAHAPVARRPQAGSSADDRRDPADARRRRRAAPRQRPRRRRTPLRALVSVMDRLRSPGGCPWDAEQTHESLVPYVLEEAHELAEAIEAGDRAGMREELGDVLLQVVFHARLATGARDRPVRPRRRGRRPRRQAGPPAPARVRGRGGRGRRARAVGPDEEGGEAARRRRSTASRSRWARWRGRRRSRDARAGRGSRRGPEGGRARGAAARAGTGGGGSRGRRRGRAARCAARAGCARAGAEDRRTGGTRRAGDAGPPGDGLGERLLALVLEADAAGVDAEGALRRTAAAWEQGLRADEAAAGS